MLGKRSFLTPMILWWVVTLRVAAGIVNLAFAQTGENMRIWKSADGKYEVEAAIVEIEGGAVKLRKGDGDVIRVPLDRLGEADRLFAERWIQLGKEARDAKAAAGFATDVLGPPIDLLSEIDTRRDTLKGNWAMEGDALVTQGESRSVLQVPLDPPEQYQLRFTVHRFRGARGLNVAIVVGGRPVMLVVDAFKGSSSGITLIDGKNEQSNVTLYRKPVLPNAPANIVCTVHRRHIHVACDGKTLVEWFGHPSQLSLFQRYWSDVPTDRILLGTWGSDFRFTNMTMIPITQSTFDDLQTTPTAHDATQSVALIEHPLGSGSGFVASRNLVVTNHHVIANAYVDDLEIHFPEQKSPLPVRQVLFEQPARDLAILLVETDRMPIPIAYDSDYSAGDEIEIHGNPSVAGGIVLRNASVTGKITATVRINSQDFFQVEASVNPGSSGGPILNRLGQVVGVTAMKATEEGEQLIREGMMRLDDSFRPASQTEGVAFGIPSGDLARALDSVRLQSAMAAERANVTHDVGVVFQRLAALFRLRMLTAFAGASDGLRRQAALARGAGRSDELVELIPASLSRQIQAELAGEQVAAMLLLFEKDLDSRIEMLKARTDVAESTRRHLLELKKYADSAEHFASRPPTNYRSFSKRLLSLQDAFNKLMSEVKDGGI